MIGKLWDAYVDLVDRVIAFVERDFMYLAVLVFFAVMVIAVISIVIEILLIGG